MIQMMMMTNLTLMIQIVMMAKEKELKVERIKGKKEVKKEVKGAKILIK